MWYQIHILNVGDADAIVIKYQESLGAPFVTAVIDAGNIDNSGDVLDCVGKTSDGTYHINYAFCSHPDTDHKGGFFNLLANRRVQIDNMCLFDPWDFLSVTDFSRIRNPLNAKAMARAPFNHPNNLSLNLISIAESRGILRKAHKGCFCPDIPIQVLGPSDNLYTECAIGMLEDYAEMKDDPNFEPYDEDSLLDEMSARSVIDLEDDSSCSNLSSMVLLFAPPGGRHFLFPGDAGCISLSPVIREYAQILRGCTLKVPHHGSRHNLSTTIIDSLRPTSAVISAKGSRKHPNSGIVYWLSRHCNVYSTHKSNGLVYGSDINGRAIPLKERIREAP